MTAKVEFTKVEGDEWPKCPYCKKELRQIKYKQRDWLTDITVFWCPHCGCLLSVSTKFNG